MPAPKKSNSKKSSCCASQAGSSCQSSIAVAELPEKPQSQKSNFSKMNPFAPKASKSTSGATQVVAQIDVGYGNSLSIRGQGAGLSWEKSQPMEYQNRTWVWTSDSKENLEFKVLLNDQVWQQGSNVQAKAGSKVVFRPVF